MGRPLLLCNPTEKVHGESLTASAPDRLEDVTVPITNPDAHLVCYRIIPRVGTPSTAPTTNRAVKVLNQFGKETIKVAQPILLCVPSTKTLPTG